MLENSGEYVPQMEVESWFINMDRPIPIARCQRLKSKFYESLYINKHDTFSSSLMPKLL